MKRYQRLCLLWELSAKLDAAKTLENVRPILDEGLTKLIQDIKPTLAEVTEYWGA